MLTNIETDIYDFINQPENNTNDFYNIYDTIIYILQITVQNIYKF